MKRSQIGVLAAAGVLLTCAAVWVLAGTTGIISGVVRSGEDGSPLSGANVIVEGTKLTTVTGADGSFVITNVAPGEYEVRAEMVGFAAQSLSGVQVSMDTTARADFGLKPEAIVEAEAVVTRPRPMINPEVVNTLNLLTAPQEAMTRTDPSSLHTVPGALSALPGLMIDPNGMGGVHMRGGRADQIGYYIEGIPVTDPNMGFFSTNLFTTGTNKFQAYPGGFGAEFGNAISGVLNEVKQTGNQMPGFHLNGEAGSQTYRSAYVQIGGGTSDRFNYYAGGILQRSEVDGGPMLRELEFSDNVAKLVWPGKNDTITVMGLQGSLAGYLNSFHDIGNLDEPTPHERDFLRQRYVIGAVTWSHSFSPSSFISVEPYYIYSGTVQNLMGGYESFLNAWSAQKGLQASYNSQIGDRHLMKVGGSWLESKNSYYVYYSSVLQAFYDMSPYRADVNTTQRSIFAQDEIKLSDKWTGELGLRWDSITYDRTNRMWVPGFGYTGDPIGDVTESQLNPRVGVSYAPDANTAWKASWGKYSKFLPSSVVQLVYEDPDRAGAEAYISGIGATRPQKSTAMDISFEKQLSDSLACRVTPFYAKYENLGDYFMDETGVLRYTTLGEGTSRGVELMLRKRASANWQGWISYTYAISKANRADAGFVGDSFYTSWDQRHTLSVVGDYKSGRFSHTLRTDVGSGRADSTPYDPTVQQRANPYLVLTYTLSYALPNSSHSGDSIYVSVFNLFNNRQALQYTFDPPWGGGARTVDSRVPSRFVSVGVNKAF